MHFVLDDGKDNLFQVLICFSSSIGFLGGVFKYVLCSPLVREDSHFDSYFSDGLVQPPTSFPLQKDMSKAFLTTEFPGEAGVSKAPPSCETRGIGWGGWGLRFSFSRWATMKSTGPNGWFGYCMVMKSYPILLGNGSKPWFVRIPIN